MTHSWSTQITWGDLDLFGHLNHLRQFYFMQEARVSLLQKLGVETLKTPNAGAPIVAAAECTFLAQVAYDDQLQVSTQVKHIGHTSFSLHYELSVNQRPVGRGSDRIVWFDYGAHQKIQLPPWLRQALQPYLQPAV